MKYAAEKHPDALNDPLANIYEGPSIAEELFETCLTSIYNLVAEQTRPPRPYPTPSSSNTNPDTTQQASSKPLCSDLGANSGIFGLESATPDFSIASSLDSNLQLANLGLDLQLPALEVAATFTSLEATALNSFQDLEDLDPDLSYSFEIPSWDQAPPSLEHSIGPSPPQTVNPADLQL